MGLLDRVSVRTKLMSLSGGLILIMCFLWASGIWFTILLSQKTTETTATLAKVARTGDSVRLVQVEFKDQVQQWKDLLIRGYDPAKFTEISSSFDDKERIVDSELSALKANFDGTEDTEIAQAVDTVLQSHRSLGAKYRTALATWSTKDPISYRGVDRQVKGIDNAFSKLI